MTFVQVMEFETDDFDAIAQISDRWFDDTAGKRTLRHELVGRDRSAPNRYVAIVTFDSYESAMVNSDLPETQAAAKEMEALTSGVTFRDFDVVREIEG